jgi:hypothetical protein
MKLRKKVLLSYSESKSVVFSMSFQKCNEMTSRIVQTNQNDSLIISIPTDGAKGQCVKFLKENKYDKMLAL